MLLYSIINKANTVGAKPQQEKHRTTMKNKGTQPAKRIVLLQGNR